MTEPNTTDATAPEAGARRTAGPVYHGCGQKATPPAGHRGCLKATSIIGQLACARELDAAGIVCYTLFI